MLSQKKGVYFIEEQIKKEQHCENMILFNMISLRQTEIGAKMQKKINITKILYFYIITFLGILIIFCAVNLNPNNDMWWMISTGRYIVQNKTIPKINPFTIHNGYGIIVQQWLTAIFNYEIYIHFGNIGFITTAILMTVLSLFLCYRYISMFTNDINTKILLISVVAFVFSSFATTRPTIFTIPVVLLELANLEKWNGDKKNIRYLLPLIFLSVLEINIHAALWPLLLILTLPYIAPGYALNFKHFVTELINRKWLIVADVLMFLSGFLSPNGVNAMLYLVKSYKKTSLMNSILELQKPAILGVWGILLIVQIVFLVLYLREYGANSDFSKVFLAAGTIFMSCTAVRNVWMAAIGCLPLLADMIPNMIRFRKEHIYELWKTFIINAVLLGCIAVILSEIAGQIENKKIPAKNAAEYLASVAEPDRERVYTSFDNGGMFEWYGFKVYTDARPELFTKEVNKKESIDSEIYNVEYGFVDYRDFIDKYDFTYIVVNDDTPFTYYLENDTKWTDVYKSGGICIYAKFL